MKQASYQKTNIRCSWPLVHRTQKTSLYMSKMTFWVLIIYSLCLQSWRTGCFSTCYLLESLPDGVLNLYLQSKLQVCHCKNEKGGRRCTGWEFGQNRREGRVGNITMHLNIYYETHEICSLYITKINLSICGECKLVKTHQLYLHWALEVGKNCTVISLILPLMTNFSLTCSCSMVKLILLLVG